MPEGLSSAFSSETPRRVLRAAKDAGYEPHEQRALLRDAGGLFADELNPKLVDRLTANAIAHLFARLEGTNATSHDLVRLGSTLFEMHGFFERYPERTIDKREQKFLGLGVKLIEDALYRGSLSRLRGKAAAELAFLANRLAKIMSLPKRQQEIVGFDEKKFRAFADSVRRFGDKYLSDERYEKELEAARERRMELETQLKSLEADFAYVSLALKGRASADAVALEKERVSNDEYVHLALEDIRQRLERALNVFREIFGRPADESERENEGLIESLGRSLLDGKAEPLVVRRLNDPSDLSIPSLIAPFGDDTEAESRQYDTIRAVRDYLIHNLRIFRKEFEGKKTVPFQKLGEKLLAGKITDDLLSVGTDISGDTGPFKALRSLLATNYRLESERKMTLNQLLQRSVGENELLSKWRAAFAEEIRIEGLRKQLPGKRLILASSNDAVTREFPTRTAAGPYFAKTMLIAADARARATSRGYLGHRAFPIIPGETAVYSFKKPEEQTWSYDLTDGRHRLNADFADVHYVADHWPFAEMAVLMQEGTSRIS